MSKKLSSNDAQLNVAIVGMGPRGLSVLERLLVKLGEQSSSQRLQIWVFDPGEPGAGRIWRTTQPEWFLMNTPTGEVSLFSGGPDGRDARAGCGPSLTQWLVTHADPRWARLGPNDYAPRSVYGEYLRFVFDSLVATAPRGVSIHPVRARVERIERNSAGYAVVAEDQAFAVDKVVLATGHPRLAPDKQENRLLSFTRRHPELRFLRGDSAADLPLDTIGSGSRVGIIGLGLTFFDVVAALTIGRGGHFVTVEHDVQRYIASGHEPVISAGSRSGLVMLARGANQKPPDYRYRPVFLTDIAIAAARRRAQRRDGSTQLDFVRDVLPMLRREVEHTYYSTYVRQRHGASAAARFAERHKALANSQEVASLKKLLSDFGIGDVPSIDFEALSRPFAGEEFASSAAFHDRLLDLLDADVAEAKLGNVDGPRKAALDILRDIRGAVRQAVDFAGLRPQSYMDDFLHRFNPINAMVSAGPPAFRVAQICALIRAGVITVVGPRARVGQDSSTGMLFLESAQVHGSRRAVDTLIDARIPRPLIHHDADPLIRQLLDDGIISEHVNVDSTTPARFRSGGIAITRVHQRVIDSSGRPDPHMYALGIPTENTRWFTQIGNGRPGPISAFHQDADVIAADILRAWRPLSGQAPVRSEHRTHQATPADSVSIAG